MCVQRRQVRQSVIRKREKLISEHRIKMTVCPLICAISGISGRFRLVIDESSKPYLGSVHSLGTHLCGQFILSVNFLWSMLHILVTVETEQGGEYRWQYRCLPEGGRYEPETVSASPATNITAPHWGSWTEQHSHFQQFVSFFFFFCFLHVYTVFGLHEAIFQFSWYSCWKEKAGQCGSEQTVFILM